MALTIYIRYLQLSVREMTHKKYCQDGGKLSCRRVCLLCIYIPKSLGFLPSSVIQQTLPLKLEPPTKFAAAEGEVNGISTRTVCVNEIQLLKKELLNLKGKIKPI